MSNSVLLRILVLTTLFVSAATLALGGTAAPMQEQDACSVAIEAIRARASASSLDSRPPWAPAGMPDMVWQLVDSAYVTEGEDVRWCLLDEAERQVDSLFEQSSGGMAPRLSQAIVTGVRAELGSGRSGVREANEFHQQLDTILEMDPDHPRARYLMGRLHMGVLQESAFVRWIATNLLGGGALKDANWEDAEEHLEYAHEHAPEVLQHHFALARLYRETERPELAREELGHVLEREPRSALGRDLQRHAREMLEELERSGIRAR